VRILLLLILSSPCVKAQFSYTIDCYLEGGDGTKVYLTNSWGGRADRNKFTTSDTAYLVNNKCTFKGYAHDLMFYSISIDSTEGFFPFIIDSGMLSVIGRCDEIWKSKVKNSAQNLLFYQAADSIDSFFELRETLQDSMLYFEQLRNIDRSRNYAVKMDAVDKRLFEYLYRFLEMNPDCYYIFWTVKQFYGLTKDTKVMSRKMYERFSQRIKMSKEGKNLQFTLFDFKSMVGTPPVSMLLHNTDNKKVNVQFSTNRVTLIDFWASWCLPCIKLLPELKRVLKEYSSTGFNIVSVSLDNNLVNWKKAVVKNGLYWKNFCDVRSFQSDYVNQYGITSIPFSILVDKSGKIVQFNPSIEELRNYLKKH